MAAVSFFEMFPFCTQSESIAPAFKDAEVINATVDQASMIMKINLGAKARISPSCLKLAEGSIAEEFGLSRVEITPSYPAAPAQPVREKSSKAGEEIADVGRGNHGQKHKGQARAHVGNNARVRQSDGEGQGVCR